MNRCSVLEKSVNDLRIMLQEEKVKNLDSSLYVSKKQKNYNFLEEESNHHTPSKVKNLNLIFVTVRQSTKSSTQTAAQACLLIPPVRKLITKSPNPILR